MRHLVLFSPGGLCNRLKVLASGRALAEAGGARLQFLWPLRQTCGCPYEHLFVPSPDVQTVQASDVEPLPRRIGWGSTPPDLLAEPGERVVLGHMSWVVRPDRYPSHERIWPAVAKHFDALVPQPGISSRVEAFARRHFRPRMIGVHLRRGDFHLWRPDVVANTGAAMRHLERHLERWPDAGIYLATDDGAGAGSPAPPAEGVRESLGAHFGDRVVYAVPRSLDRATPEAIEDALMELLLLRRTDAVVGTASSSFSQLAAFGRDVPFAETAGGSGRVVEIERLARRWGLYRPIIALARLRLGREPERFYVAWMALRDSPLGERGMRLIRRVMARRS